MDCRIVRGNIAKYLDGDLKDKELRHFMTHIDSCDSCKEELKLHYLVKEGFNRLENGGSLNLQKEFELMLDKTRERSVKLKKWDAFIRIAFVVSFTFAFVILMHSLIFMQY